MCSRRPGSRSSSSSSGAWSRDRRVRGGRSRASRRASGCEVPVQRAVRARLSLQPLTERITLSRSRALQLAHTCSMRLYALLLLQCCASSSLAAQAPTALAALRPPSRLRRRLKDRERVRLGVEHVPVERHERVLAEQEVQVLERLGEPERLHAVLVHDGDAVDVLDAGEPARGELAVRREGEEDAPALRADEREGGGRGSVRARARRAIVLGGGGERGAGRCRQL